MSSIGYKLKCLKNLNVSTLLEVVDSINKKTKLSKNYLLMDMIICSNKYGTGYHDYQEFELYNLNKLERKTYLTRVKNNAIVRKFNNKEYFKYFDNKYEFNKKFDKYVKREWMVINNNYEDFIKFCSNKKEIIVKPIDGCGGIGVELIKIDNKKIKNII